MSKGILRQERAETSLQAVILVPVVFLVVFMCFHVAALIHQGHVAMAIAVRGAEISSSFSNDPGVRLHAVNEMKVMSSELRSRIAGTPRITYETNSVVVTVNLIVNGAVPFLPQIASATARQTLERFVPEQDRE